MQEKYIGKVLPCIADPWKLRIIAYLDEEPDLTLIAKYLDGKYSEKLGLVVVKRGIREMNFFRSGQVTVRMVDTESEATALVNGLLAMACHKAMITGEI